MSRHRTLALVAVTALTAGCGGHVQRPEPRLPQRDAAQLAALARQIERDAPSDGCAAKNEITALATKAHALVAAGRVPLQLRAALLRGVESLLADTPACAPPAPTPAPARAPAPAPAPPAPIHGKGHQKDHGHGHGHDQGDEG